MAATDNASAKRRFPRAARIALWSLSLVALTVLTLLAGVGLAAVLGDRGQVADWSKWSRDYWKAAERARATLVPGTEEYELTRKVDELWRHYEAVVAARPRKVKDIRTQHDERPEAAGNGPDTPEAA